MVQIFPGTQSDFAKFTEEVKWKAEEGNTLTNSWHFMIQHFFMLEKNIF